MEMAGEIEIENGSGVDAATRGFELVDDLHGANLGRTGDCPRGEAGSESIEAIDVGAKPAAEGGDQMHNVGIALDKLETFDLHRSVFTDATELVAAEVQQHDAFGELLGISSESGGKVR